MARVLAALVLLLAGCSGLSTVPGANETNASAEPAGNGTTATLDGGADGTAVVGIDDGRLTNASALIDAHVEALAGSGYAYAATVESRPTEGNATHSNTVRWEVRVGADGSAYELYDRSGGLSRDQYTETWRNDTVSVEYSVRSTPFGNDTGIYRASEPSGALGANYSANLAPTFLRAGEYVVAGRHGNGSLTLAANGTRDGTVDGHAVSSFDGRALVDAEGRVRSLSVTLSVADPEITQEYRYRLTDVGDVSVSRPDWFDTALERAVIVEAIMRDDYVAVTNTGRSTVDAGTRVFLWEGASGADARLDAPIAPGETVYLYRPAGETGAVEVSRTPPSGAVATLDGSYRVELTDGAYDPLAEVRVG